jgi:tRNA dimethylallyltransferase
VAQWKRSAQRAIANIVRRGKIPIVCGGTGFWIDTLVYDAVLPDVKPNPKLRAKLQKLTPSQLFAKLKHLDPIRASKIDQHNPVRLIRALEIIITTGKPVPSRSARSSEAGQYHVLYLGISVPQKKLNQRIEKRLDARLKAGMIKEIKNLHASGISWKRLESFGLEYRFVARYLQGKISNQQMRASLLSDIIRYSKRQLTWWRRNKNIVWIKQSASLGEVARQVADSLSL